MVERIVIVDDEEGILALLRRVLRAPGREVEVFPSAATALESMRRHRPDVVITDLHMPGMTGSDFVRSIRDEFGGQIGIIVITAFPTLVSDADAVANGIGAYLRKPFTDLDLLRSTVSEVIESTRRTPDDAVPERFRRSLAAVDAALRRQRASLSRADAVLDQISDAILIADRNGRLLQVNGAAARLLGLDAEDCLGRPLNELRVDAQLRQAILDPGPCREEGHAPERAACSRRVFLEQSGRTCEVTTAPLVGAGGAGAGIFAVIRDVSAEVRVHELKHHYLTVVAHELRTPLTALTNFAAVFEKVDAAPLAPPQHTMVEGIRRQVQRLEHQIDKLILLARLERGDFAAPVEPFDVAPAVLQALDTCQADARERGIDFEIALPPEPLMALGDADDFKRALYEVGENAVKFTPSGGRVRATAELADQHVVVHVADTGIGIEPRDLPLIFAPFKQLEDPLTRHHAGAGLGLSLARRMLEAVGGKLTVESQPKSGSTFHLLVPRERRMPPAPPEGARLLPAPAPERTGEAPVDEPAEIPG